MKLKLVIMAAVLIPLGTYADDASGTSPMRPYHGTGHGGHQMGGMEHGPRPEGVSGTMGGMHHRHPPMGENGAMPPPPPPQDGKDGQRPPPPPPRDGRANGTPPAQQDDAPIGGIQAQ